MASNLLVKSPEHSPNTDGIHISETQTISIMKSVIKTGKQTFNKNMTTTVNPETVNDKFCIGR